MVEESVHTIEEIHLLIKDIDEKMENMRTEIDRLTEENEKTKTKYEKEIGRLKEANLNHLNGLKLFDENSHMLITDHQKKIDELKENHREEIDSLTLYNPESDMKIKEHNKEVNGIKDTIVRGTIAQKDTIGELEDSLKFVNYIRGRHKPKIKELKEGIKYFAMISQYSESDDDEIVQEVKKEGE